MSICETTGEDKTPCREDATIMMPITLQERRLRLGIETYLSFLGKRTRTEKKRSVLQGQTTTVTFSDKEHGPEEVEMWGISLLADERSDVILLKFLRTRDFKVKDVFNMLKNIVRWRKEFGIDALVLEDFIID
ncbi:patellin-4-like [Vigna radiata var. radiata]|uniref:Patellin-4-like n=1 Tax=Vigna radiata var. radiata TaxID=3916 RepID=A0A1S3UK61_VIGRR|nr:patellin-4-like [Vigna radiata var. radiata]